MSKRALITGITGQNGTYLAEFLLEKGYEVHGLSRCPPSPAVRQQPAGDSPAIVEKRRPILHTGDLNESGSLIRLIQDITPDEIYNLAAQSHVDVSFALPEFTANCDAIGPLRLLEAIRILGREQTTRLFQASTSELFGAAQEFPQTESTPFRPGSPYGTAKLYAHWIVRNYREAFGLFACSGILFNHESPIRGETFVTRKVTRALTRIKVGLQDCLCLGNLNARRDWGHARDFVEAQWLMLQQETADDYVIATGELHTLREFVEAAAGVLDLPLVWDGSGVDERGIDPNTGRCLVAVDPAFFRPSDPGQLVGDATKARQQLGWAPRISFTELVREMTLSDLKIAQDELRQE